MSIQTDPDEVVPLLERLKKAIPRVYECDALVSRINKIENEVKGLFPEVKESEKKLLELFSTLDRSLPDFDSQNFNSLLDGVEVEINKIKESVSQVHQLKMRRHDRRGLSKLEEKILVDLAMENFQVSFDRLDRFQLKMCLLFLSIFPENAVIKKRPLIYWWIGEGLVKTEDEGDRVFQELLKRDLIIKPRFNDKCPVVNKCQLHPWIRYMLISLAKRAKLFDFDAKGTPLFDNNNIFRRACLGHDVEISSGDNISMLGNLRTIFNVDKKYLDFPAEKVAKMKKLVVLQLGRWQESPTHDIEDQSKALHIEVQSEAFLKELRTQKHLKYLSLGGISRITILPPSIVELVNLEILDLKACHNLEMLPPDIAPLRKLTHLDVSECYLLESMPKGLEKLKSLQVLKGFVIGNSKKTPCRIEDLRSLEELKRLSIHIGSEAVIKEDEFDKLEHLKKVSCLKISWGVVSRKLKDQVIKQSFTFPASLEKLDLEGIPQEKPEWLKPSKLKELKKLYIKGGKLNSLDHGDPIRWKVEILRLKFLKNLDVEFQEVREMFPNLKYVLKRESEEAGARNFEWNSKDLEASLQG